MKYILFTLSLFITLTVTGQETYVTTMPKAPYNLMKYLSDNIRYPDSARKNNITGRVVMQFVVAEDGSITDCHVLHGIGGGCDEEALRVIRNMPRWNPGMHDGRAVRVKFTQPIAFSLADYSHPPIQKTDATGNTTFSYVEQYPHAGYNMSEYLKEHLHYPKRARKDRIEGEVIVQFFVNEDGSISNCAVAQSLREDCDKEALLIIQNMPAWQPGRQGGRAVRVQYRQQVVFSLK